MNERNHLQHTTVLAYAIEYLSVMVKAAEDNVRILMKDDQQKAIEFDDTIRRWYQQQLETVQAMYELETGHAYESPGNGPITLSLKRKEEGS